MFGIENEYNESMSGEGKITKRKRIQVCYVRCYQNI